MLSSVTIASRVLCACAKPGMCWITWKNGGTPSTTASATAPVAAIAIRSFVGPQDGQHREHQRQRARVEGAGDDERLALDLGRAAPVVGQREREAEAQRGLGGVAARRGSRGRSSAPAAPRTAAGSAAASAVPASTPPANQRNFRGPRSSAKSVATASTWKLVSGCPPVNWTATASASSASARPDGRRRTALSVASSTHGSHAQTEDSGQDEPDDVEEPEARDEPGEQRSAVSLAQLSGKQVGAERGDPQLQRADEAERPPERQDVGGPRERREDRRLHVREERAAALDVRVPERDVRQPCPRVGQKRLELGHAVGHLVVRAEGAHAVRLLRRPRRDRPQQVGRGEGATGDQGGCDEGQRQRRVEQRGGKRRPPAQRGGG